jgi:integrase
MILFGLYTGQRLGDIASLRWSDLDLVRGELRLSTRKTDKTMVLPLAAPLRKHPEFSSLSSNEASAPIHPKAYDLVERQGKTGNLSHQFADWLKAARLRQKRNRPGNFRFFSALSASYE